MSIQLVVVALSSLRGTGKILQLFEEWFTGEIPCHTVVQDWIMRYGLYQLRKQPQKRDDWVYVLDHTIDFGTKKCLLVLGITLEKLHDKQFNIEHKDMEVLAIGIEESATGESVRRTLEAVYHHTGTPAQIVSDGGSNINKGVVDFQKDHSAFIKTYDITHKAALIIKKQIAEDKNWKRLYKQIAYTKKAVVHTRIAFLAPPKAREKSRWMNLETYINWAEKIMRYEQIDMPDQIRELYNHRLGWVKEFEFQIKEWRTIINIIKCMEKEIKSNGLSTKTKKKVKVELEKLELDTIRLRHLQRQILKCIEVSTEKIKKGEIYLGCSDIIESVFSKYKSFSAKTPMKEIGKAVLTIPVYTSEINPEEVKEAMEQISTKDLHYWLEENIGKTLFSQRKQAYNQVYSNSPVNLFPNKLQKAANF